jgi:hypothetical protein
LVFLDRDDDDGFLAVFGHHLRPVSPRTLDQLAEVLF